MVAQIRNWQFNVNQATGNTSASTLLLQVKNALTGFASNPWIVTRSSNSVSVSNSDTWSNAANVVFAGGNHSWIVLHQPVTSLYILIDLGIGSIEFINLWVSKNPFTGGTISTAPTSTNSFQYYASDTWGAYAAGSSSWTWSVMHSSDGYGTRVIWWRDVNNNWASYWVIDYLDGYTVSPCSVVYFLGTTILSIPSVGNLTGSGYYVSPTGTNWVNCAPTQAGTSGVNINEAIPNYNEIDGYFQLDKVGFYSPVANSRSHMGYIKDFYLTSSDAIPDRQGGLFDSGRWIAFGPVLLPWNGSVVSRP